MHLPSPILVIGAGGFIGSHLAELCVEQGAEVRAFVHYNANSSWGWLEESPHRDAIEVVSGDVRDFDAVYRAVADCGTVLHPAALIGIPYSYRSPLAYLRTNAEGTYNVLEAARLHGTPRVAVTSTSETYGTAQYVPIDEKHPAVAQSPYAATKVAADELAISYHRSFDLPVWIVRPFNTYGPRQSARAFIPSVISQILSDQTTLQLGNLSPTRDLTFVKDTAAGFLAVVGCDELVGDATNIGTGTEISMGDLAHMVAELVGSEITIETEADRVRPDRSEVERLVCNNTRVRQATGWQPAHDLESGLTETIAWVQQHLDRYKPALYSV